MKSTEVKPLKIEVNPIDLKLIEMRSLIEAVAIDLTYLICLMQQHGLEATTLPLRTTSKRPPKTPLSSKNPFSGLTEWWQTKFFPHSNPKENRLKAKTSPYGVLDIGCHSVHVGEGSSLRGLRAMLL